MKFEGAFETPAFSVLAQPFPIAGRGHVKLGKTEVEVSAFAVADSVLLISLITFGILGSILVGFAIAALFHFTALFFVPPALACVALARVKARTGAACTVAIPWRCVRMFRANWSGKLVRIQVKGMKPKGEIRFAPEKGVAHLLQALEDHGVSGP